MPANTYFDLLRIYLSITNRGFRRVRPKREVPADNALIRIPCENFASLGGIVKAAGLGDGLTRPPEAMAKRRLTMHPECWLAYERLSRKPCYTIETAWKWKR